MNLWHSLNRLDFTHRERLVRFRDCFERNRTFSYV
jgi:hypothetical protein